MLWLWIGLALLVAFIALGFGWRWTSRRRVLPCPSWLAWSLEGGIADWAAGTQRTLDHLGLRPGMRILEIGPGPGRLLVPAAKRILPGGEAVGLDIQPGMIARLEARARAEGLTNLRTILGDAARQHVAAESFDLVYLCTVLGEIPDREAALRECYRALVPGGILSITEIIGDPHYQTRRTAQRLAETAGFRPRQLHGSWRSYTANFEKP
jgi:ubiquinone/menaquinone biosynthesis C-methylase UbiE